MPDRPTLLVIADIVPGRRSGGEQRLFRMCEVLVERWRVSLVAVLGHRDLSDTDRREALRRAGVDVLDLHGPQAARAALVSNVFRVVMMEFWQVAEPVIPLARRLQPWAALAVDTVDLHFVRERQAVAMGDLPATGVEERARRELATYRAADARIFTSEAERALYRAASDDRSEDDLVVPIVVRPHQRRRRARHPTVVFVGNFWHAPNVDAVVWFVGEVWPIIRGAVPAATLALAGANVWSKVQALEEFPGVAVCGYVDDLVSFYDEASVAVAPIRYGAGVKGKVCEALADAVPVVSTTPGIDGLFLRPGEDLRVADDAESFADAVVDLLTEADAAAHMGARGQESILEQCDVARAREALGRLTSSLSAAPSPSGPRWRARVTTERARMAVAGAGRKGDHLVRRVIGR